MMSGPLRLTTGMGVNWFDLSGKCFVVICMGKGSCLLI